MKPLAPHTQTLMVFPLDMDETAPFVRVAKALGITVIGASSAMASAGAQPVDHFIHLPFVTDSSFDGAMRKAIQLHGVQAVFAPHEGVWQHLRNLVRQAPAEYPIRLCEPDPFTATGQLFEPQDRWAARVVASELAEGLEATALRPHLPHAHYAALHRLFMNTPGQSDEHKLQVLCDIARVLPKGDVIEIGSLYGRSAIALAFLAQRHCTGSLVCVDPWRTADTADQGPQAAALNQDLARVNRDQIFSIFLSTAAMLNNIGYIRATSGDAYERYATAHHAGRLASEGLGQIKLSQTVSLVHIDGNHRFDHVLHDVKTWAPLLCAEGWLLIDDYVWAFGDGPKRVGDLLLHNPAFDRAFVSGDTLFLRCSRPESASAEKLFPEALPMETHP